MFNEFEERLAASQFEIPSPGADVEERARRQALLGAAEGYQEQTPARPRRFSSGVVVRRLRASAARRARQPLAIVLGAALPSIVLGALVGVLLWPGTTSGQNPPFPGPTFGAAAGWTVVLSAQYPSNSSYAAAAWATNASVSGNPFGTSIEEGPLQDLPAEGVVISVSDLGEMPAATREKTYVDRDLPLQIEDADIQSHWLGQPNENIPQYILLARLNGQWIDVRIYFGRQHPTSTMLGDAQNELDRLNIPTADALRADGS